MEEKKLAKGYKYENAVAYFALNGRFIWLIVPEYTLRNKRVSIFIVSN